MTENNSNVPARVATVALTKTMLDEPKNLNEMIQIPAIQDRWIKTYESVSNKKDGEMRFAAEMILFQQAAAKLEKCDRFSVYASFIELSISGLTLRDGLTYIVPFGNKAQFMVGWKGRLEQMLEVPSIIHISEPQLVYSCDQFDYEKGMQTIIHGHKPVFPRPDDATIMFVYMIVHFRHGKEVFMMDSDEVLNIRDKYSKSYGSYMKALANEKNKTLGKKYGDTLVGSAKGQNGWYDFDIEPPMWITSEGQAFKKTLVKRAWNNVEKLPKHQLLDEKFNDFIKNNPEAQFVDPDEQNNHDEAKRLQIQSDAVKAALGNIEIIDGDKVDTTTGEVITPHTEVKAEPKKRTAAPKKTAATTPGTASPEPAAEAEHFVLETEQEPMEDEGDESSVPDGGDEQMRAAEDDVDTSTGF